MSDRARRDVPSRESSGVATCVTMGHESIPAVRYLSCEGDGAYPYCQQCAEILARCEVDHGDVVDERGLKAHALIQTIRGLCTDEADHRLIDAKLAELDELVYPLDDGGPE